MLVDHAVGHVRSRDVAGQLLHRHLQHILVIATTIGRCRRAVLLDLAVLVPRPDVEIHHCGVAVRAGVEISQTAAHDGFAVRRFLAHHALDAVVEERVARIDHGLPADWPALQAGLKRVQAVLPVGVQHVVNVHAASLRQLAEPLRGPVGLQLLGCRAQGASILGLALLSAHLGQLDLGLLLPDAGVTRAGVRVLLGNAEARVGPLVIGTAVGDFQAVVFLPLLIGHFIALALVSPLIRSGIQPVLAISLVALEPTLLQVARAFLVLDAADRAIAFQ